MSFGGPQSQLRVPPEAGILRQIAYGDAWDCYIPVRPGDTFKVWGGTQKLEDITSLDGKSLRKFKIFDTLKYINQKEEVTSVYHRCNVYMIIPPGMTKKDFIMPSGNPEYHRDLSETQGSKYSKEEMAAINRIAEAEEIRGTNPRYWEDVNTGDKLKPIVQGPLTLWDGILNMQSFGIFQMPTREVARKTPNYIVTDPETNIPHNSFMWRIDPGVAKSWDIIRLLLWSLW